MQSKAPSQRQIIRDENANAGCLRRSPRAFQAPDERINDRDSGVTKVQVSTEKRPVFARVPAFYF